MISKSHTKYIQTLLHKKFRDESGLFIAEGPKVVMELLEGGYFVCKEVFALKKWLEANEGLITAHHSTAFNEVQEFELEKISALIVPNLVLAVFEKRKPVEDIICSGRITIALDTIQDPGNMGTIIRNADWFGVQSIVCSPDCADIYNPKVVQSTMGSLGRVNVLYVDLPQWLQEQEAVKKYAAALDGRPVNTIRGIREAIIIIGNESKGISEVVMQMADERITIPRMGGAESLNAAVATGIILSHML